jgi:type IV pilus assembly protein PilB
VGLEYDGGVGRVLLGELFVNGKVITREQLDEVLAMPRVPGKKIGQILIEKGWVTEAQLTQTLSLQLGIPWVSLYHIDFSRQLLNRVPRDLAEKYCLVPIFVRHVKGQGDTLYIATDDPKNESAIAEVVRSAGLPARPMIASPSDIRSAIRVYYGDGAADPPIPTPEVLPPTRPDPPPVPPKREERRSVPTPPPPPPNAPVIVPAAAPSQPGPSSTPSAPPPPPASPSAPPPPMSRPSRPSDLPPGGRKPRMVALTLLDGTTLSLPARGRKRTESIPPSAGGVSEALTARDLVSALRAVSHGADASEILGDQPQWEPILAALLSIMLRKGLIADWEFIDEYRKI